MTTDKGFEPKARYSVTECLELLGVSRGTFYARVAADLYKVVRDGRRTFMLHADLVAALGGDKDLEPPKCPGHGSDLVDGKCPDCKVEIDDDAD